MEKFERFAVDPRGYVVLCNDNQLNKIYRNHPELTNFWATVKDMRAAIENASMIFQSTHGERFHVYYLSRPGRNAELKVVVYFDRDNEGILCAAQPSAAGQRKPGEKLIWPATNTE